VHDFWKVLLTLVEGCRGWMQLRDAQTRTASDAWARLRCTCLHDERRVGLSAYFHLKPPWHSWMLPEDRDTF